MTRPPETPTCAVGKRRPCAADAPDALDGRRVLLVEDDPLVLATHEDLLLRWGCVVIAADDAESALDLALADGPVDAVLTDFRLPGMSGVALVDALRAERPWLPAIVVSGEGPAGWAALGAQDVLTAWLTKPVLPARLKPLLIAACCRHVVWRACRALAP
jgi:CheY-like chemotaxis protein